MENQPLFENRLNVADLNGMAQNIRQEISKVIVGQEQVLDLLLTALLSNGHVLLEGVPGIAKTMMAKLLAKTIHTDFSRIQFTPDLMPSDVIGTTVFHAGRSEFEFKPGPLFSNLVLIDEINRSPAKTQAALFEAMEERQVTVDGHTYQMEPPFLVIATQNPVEHEGTYRLPEAQLDRFLFKIEVGYPSLEQEIKILSHTHTRQYHNPLESIRAVVSAQDIMRYQKVVSQIVVEEHLIHYIAKIIEKTRHSNALYLGASPRASIAVLNASKAWAALEGRDFVTPDDIRYVLTPVLRHRIILTPEKEMEGVKPEAVIKQVVDSVEVPR
ncbi:MAG: MoxR family ATPase [Breznakibacter sp.]